MTVQRRLMAAAFVIAVASPAIAQDHAAHRQQSPQHHAEEARQIEQWLATYDAAFNAKDLERLGQFYHPDVTIYEGGGIDNGWASYRDHHLAPELKAFENLQFGHTDRTIQVLGDGRTAYAIAKYFIKARMGERVIDGGGLETLVLVKDASGTWKIRHSHTSSRPRRPASGGL